MEWGGGGGALDDVVLLRLRSLPLLVLGVRQPRARRGRGAHVEIAAAGGGKYSLRSGGKQPLRGRWAQHSMELGFRTYPPAAQQHGGA
jgi:hypothetical protein